MGRKSDLRILGNGANRREWLIRASATAVAGVLPTPSSAQPKVAPPTIIKAGSFVMSINPTLPPLQYANDKGELMGLRPELGNEIAKRLGLTPEYIRIDGVTTMIPGLAAKRWDMINTGTFWTEERSKIMYMVPYELVALEYSRRTRQPAENRKARGFRWPKHLLRTRQHRGAADERA